LVTRIIFTAVLNAAHTFGICVLEKKDLLNRITAVRQFRSRRNQHGSPTQLLANLKLEDFFSGFNLDIPHPESVGLQIFSSSASVPAVQTLFSASPPGTPATRGVLKFNGEI